MFILIDHLYDVGSRRDVIDLFGISWEIIQDLLKSVVRKGMCVGCVGVCGVCVCV